MKRIERGETVTPPKVRKFYYKCIKTNLSYDRKIVEEVVSVAETDEEITEVEKADHVTDDHHRIVDHQEHLDHVMILMTVQNLE